MDLGNGLVSYNGWTNSLTRQTTGAPADGWELISADISPIGVTQYLDKKALQDGMDAIEVYENARTIHMIVGVYGSTKGSFWDNLETLLHSFNPVIAYNADTANVGFLALNFYQPTASISTWPTSTYPNGIPLRFYARPAASPTYNLDRERLSGFGAKGLSAQAALTLIARDPRKYNQTAISTSLTTGHAALSYKGNFPTFPVVTFSLSASGSSAFSVTIEHSVITIDLSALSSGTYTLDYGARTFVDSNGTTWIGKVSSSSNWGTVTGSGLIYGLSYLTNPTGLTGNLATLTYREAWA